MSTSKTFGVKIEVVDGDHVVSVRDLIEVVTSGDSVEHALIMAKDAILVAIEGRIEDGETPPDPTPVRHGECPVEVTY